MKKTKSLARCPHPWEDVVDLYERIYDKASEITQRDAKLWGLKKRMDFRGITLMHIDNMLQLNGCNKADDEDVMFAAPGI